MKIKYSFLASPFLKSFFTGTALILLLAFSNSLQAQCSTDLGIFYWGGGVNGVPSNGIVAKGKQLSDDLGVNTMWFTLASTNDLVYGSGNSCITGSNLTDLAQRADFNSIITDPQFSTVVITAYDWTSFGDCSTQNFLDTAFYTPANTALIEQEYTDLANYLKQFSSKTFIIAQWEGDNAVYCGASYANAVNIGNCPDYQKNFIAYKKWLDARSAGIRAAGGSNIKIGLEFNSAHRQEDNGLPSMLNDIIPNTDLDYYLYSSYESINFSAAQLSADIDFIRGKLSSYGKSTSSLLIGEMGFGKNEFGGAANAATRLKDVIDVAKQKNIPIAIVWTLLDTPNDYGVYDEDGLLTLSGQVIKNYETPEISFASGVLSSSADVGNQWYFNGNFISGESAQQYTPVKGGAYSVVVTDPEGCTKTSAPYSFAPVCNQLIAFSDPLDTLGAYSLRPCAGQNNGQLVAVVYNGSGSYSYTWNNGLTGTSFTNPNFGSYVNGIGAGTYAVTVTDDANGCVTSTITNLSNSPFNWSISTGKTNPTTIGGVDGSVTADVLCSNCFGTSNGYAWSPGGYTTKTVNGLSAGTYTVTVTLSKTLCSQTATITLKDPSTGIVEYGSQIEIIASPVPAHDVIHLTLNGLDRNTIQLNLYSITGELIHSDVVKNNSTTLKTELTIPEYANGIYWIEIISGKNIAVKKVLVDN